MNNEQQPMNTQPTTSSQVPIAWRVGLAIMALVVILFFAWQVFNKTTEDTDQSTLPEVAEDVGEPLTDDNNSETVNNSSAEELFQLGNNYYKNQAWDAAIASYKQAIELDPTYYDAYANLGAVYYAQQNLDLATETYQKAIELSPNDADLFYNLGAIYLQQALQGKATPDQDKLELAEKQISRAIELNPDLAEPYYAFGVVHEQKGNIAEAIKAFETFLELEDGTDPRAVGEAETILQTLKDQQ